MDDALDRLKRELEIFGQQNDRTVTGREGRMLNITRDTGEFLSVLVRATGARDLLEIGTSNGYSTLWLAEAAKVTGGRVTTVEYLESKYRLAAESFAKAGLAQHIELLHADAADILKRTPDASVDFLFLDSDRAEYVAWFADIKRVLRNRGLLVVDNAVSHEQQMMPFIELLQSDAAFTTSLVPVGKGEFLATKAASG
ncbi:O-methyltransferase [Marinobacter fonticola]|uniref:O-methyltransferase n=1 Tax=Marinobacter fonticola TaxID=2603215 RepID=UPI0011E776F7|nr:class I SAM-dependent methyltransferase [Marinobacter fonticola]